MQHKLKLLPLELMFFSFALIALFFANFAQLHFGLCPLKALKFNFCPGCGLGHSLHFLMHGNFEQAWQTHYLAFFALPMIIYRIFMLTFKLITK